MSNSSTGTAGAVIKPMPVSFVNAIDACISIQVPNEKKPWHYRVTVREAETNAALSSIAIPEGYAMAPLFSPSMRSLSAGRCVCSVASPFEKAERILAIYSAMGVILIGLYIGGADSYMGGVTA